MSPGTLEAEPEDGELPGPLATNLYLASPHRCRPPQVLCTRCSRRPHTHGPSTAASGTPHPAPSQPPSWFQFVDGCICVCLNHPVRHLMPCRLCLVHSQRSDMFRTGEAVTPLLTPSHTLSWPVVLPVSRRTQCIFYQTGSWMESFGHHAGRMQVTDSPPSGLV